MRLRTRLNLVVTGLSAAFVVVLIAAEIQGMRDSVREETEAANRIASQFLGRTTALYSNVGGPEAVLQFLRQLGHVRANEVSLYSSSGQLMYSAPPATYKVGREAPEWFTRLLAPPDSRYTFELRGGLVLVVEAQPSRALLDAWDEIARLALIARMLKPFPIIVGGLERVQRGDLGFRLPPLAGFEAQAIGEAFNRMAQGVQDKVSAEQKALEAEARLEERRQLASMADQRVEEERRLIAHELHDEFGQSVTAIRSLAVAIKNRVGETDAETGDVARLISDEAGRLYDAMHGLIPRLTPLSLDTLGLSDTLENLVRDWQRRHPETALSLTRDIKQELSPTVALTVYRVVQEGLINALRHSQALRIDIRVISDAHSIRVSVTDNGVGLPPDWSHAGHYGLRGLKDRVDQLKGTFGVGAGEGGGVRLHADIALGSPA
jgi:two-component system, NarL family, sensor histidine kinase UhpB